MRALLAIALALPLASARIATPIGQAPFAPSFAVGQDAGQIVVSVWQGTWQGTTVSGQPIVLDLQVKAQRMTGRLTVGKQSASITAGKALDNAFALTTGKIDGHSVSATGRQVGDAIELTIDGVKEPLTLTRVN
ncbi:MAG TPA: hypothetical protein VHZ73_04410 [Vicinamibacterales bacterium]|nr:hypothetical protein [Vicinamibacterales bacterium]